MILTCGIPVPDPEPVLCRRRVKAVRRAGQTGMVIMLACAVMHSPAYTRTAVRAAKAVTHHATRVRHHHYILHGCLSSGPVIDTHGRKLRAIGSHGKLLAPVGSAVYYTDKRHSCMPGKHTRRRG